MASEFVGEHGPCGYKYAHLRRHPLYSDRAPFRVKKETVRCVRIFQVGRKGAVLVQLPDLIGGSLRKKKTAIRTGGSTLRALQSLLHELYFCSRRNDPRNIRRKCLGWRRAA